MPDPKKVKVKRRNRVTSVKNADGTITKTRVRRDGSTKKIKTYKGNKTVASKVVKYRKDGSEKKVVTRPGDKSGTIVTKTNKKGKTTTYNKKKRLKRNLKTAAYAAGTVGAVATVAGAGLALPALKGMFAAPAIDILKKARPIKAMQNAAKWIGKGVKNKIQTGNRKGRFDARRTKKR